MSLKATVIIPAYNAEKTISETLKGLDKQSISRNQFEVIVIDDGSTDNTINEVKKFKGIQIIQGKHNGPATARNNGAKKANASIIIFLDSDTIPSPQWLEEMLKPFDDPDVVGVQGAYKSNQKELIAKFIQLEIEYRYQKLLSAKNLDWIGSYSAGYRKEVFLEKGFERDFKQASGEDPEFSYWLQKHGFKLVFQPKALLYHKHVSSFYEYLKKKFIHAKWRVLLYKMHPDKAVSDSYTPQTLKLQIIFLIVVFFSGIFTLFNPSGLIVFATAGLIFSLLMWPFTFFVMKKDPVLGSLTTSILFLQNIAFILGLSAGFLEFLIKRKSKTN